MAVCESIVEIVGVHSGGIQLAVKTQESAN